MKRLTRKQKIEIGEMLAYRVVKGNEDKHTALHRAVFAARPDIAGTEEGEKYINLSRAQINEIGKIALSYAKTLS